MHTRNAVLGAAVLFENSKIVFSVALMAKETFDWVHEMRAWWIEKIGSHRFRKIHFFTVLLFRVVV